MARRLDRSSLRTLLQNSESCMAVYFTVGVSLAEVSFTSVTDLEDVVHDALLSAEANR